MPRRTRRILEIAWWLTTLSPLLWKEGGPWGSRRPGASVAWRLLCKRERPRPSATAANWDLKAPARQSTAGLKQS